MRLMIGSLNLKVSEAFSNYERYKFEKGQVLISPDQEPNCVYQISSGFVRQFFLSQKGSDLTIHIFKPGDFFPLMWAVGEIPNSYTYEAITQIELIKIPREQTLEFLKKDPENLIQIIQSLYAALSGILFRLESQVFETSDRRVASTLLLLAKDFGNEKRGEVKINLKFTHNDIGKIAGLVRETTSLEIEKLIKEGVIKYEGRYLKIRNLNKLRSKASVV